MNTIGFSTAGSTTEATPFAFANYLSVDASPSNEARFKIERASSSFKKPHDSRRYKVKRLRKLKGFVIQFESDTVRVMMRDKKGEEFEYRFPSNKLWDAHIRVENQPFEIEEQRITNSFQDVPIYQTILKPMVPASTASIGKLDLGSDYEKKRALIMEYFGTVKAKNAKA